jgi:hypothetical protein
MALAPAMGCTRYDPTATPHGTYSAAKLTLIQGDKTMSYADGGAHFDPSGAGFLSLSADRPFRIATTPVRMTNIERLSLTLPYKGTGTGPMTGSVRLSRYDAAGAALDVFRDDAAKITLQGFTQHGTGPWGPIITTSGSASGTGSDAGAGGAYTVTFEITKAQR